MTIKTFSYKAAAYIGRKQEGRLLGFEKML